MPKEDEHTMNRRFLVTLAASSHPRFFMISTYKEVESCLNADASPPDALVTPFIATGQKSWTTCSEAVDAGSCLNTHSCGTARAAIGSTSADVDEAISADVDEATSTSTTRDAELMWEVGLGTIHYFKRVQSARTT
jgi:hypothetical protein